MSKRRVVITGVGLVTPVGNDVKTSWDNILKGKSGAAKIETFDVSEFSTQFSASVKDFDPELYVKKKDLKKMDLFIQYGLGASIQALDDSGM